MSKMAQLAVRYKKRVDELEEILNEPWEMICKRDEEIKILKQVNQSLKSTLQSIASEGENCLITSDLAAELIKRAKDALE